MSEDIIIRELSDFADISKDELPKIIYFVSHAVRKSRIEGKAIDRVIFKADGKVETIYVEEGDALE